MPPLEAMSCGVPVLVSSSASLPEVTGDCAVIVDAYSVQSIADGIGKLYENRDLCRKLSESGIRRAEQFSWKNSAEMLYNIYCEAVSL
jgi:glycosyltransferase involved in cell wall biosynthesis